MKTLPLTNSDQVALVDAEDYDRVKGFPWHANRKNGRIIGVQYSLRLSYAILQASPGSLNGMVVDHINRNPLDNCRHNLRIVTRKQNQRNIRPPRNGSSQFKGVSLLRNKYWRAQIKKDEVNTYLGLYPTEEAAARAYDAAARELFGQYAYLNFPDESPPIQLPIQLKLDNEGKIRHCPTCGQVIDE